MERFGGLLSLAIKISLICLIILTAYKLYTGFEITIWHTGHISTRESVKGDLTISLEGESQYSNPINAKHQGRVNIDGLSNYSSNPLIPGDYDGLSKHELDSLLALGSYATNKVSHTLTAKERTELQALFDGDGNFVGPKGKQAQIDTAWMKEYLNALK